MVDVGHIFRENEILMTGANGFVGKVIVSLLLDRYPDLKHLHVVIRAPGAAAARERFAEQVLASPALEPAIKRHGAGIESKVTVWAGDVSKPMGGLDEGALNALRGRVRLVLNCAGRVDFFPPVDESFRSNVDGVENLIDLARALDAKLLHVSTAFVCGAASGLVDETDPIVGYYPRRRGKGDSSFHPRVELDHCRQLIRQIRQSESAGGPGGDSDGARSRETSQRLTALGRHRASLWGWVNTYTYAKSLGEQLLALTEDVDYAIVRPAIVESALQFPTPGWIEGGRTAAPLVLMGLSGLKEWPVLPGAPLEVVPVDHVAGATLAVAALLLAGKHERVYHLGSADVNPIDLGSLVKLLDRAGTRIRRERTNGHSKNGARLAAMLAGSRGPGARLSIVTAAQARARRARVQHRVQKLQSRLGKLQKSLGAARLPGGGALAALDRGLRMIDLQAGFREQTIEQYLPFIFDNRFIFESENIRRAYTQLGVEDRRRIPWSPEAIDWEHYWLDLQIPGIEKWVQPDAVRDWQFQL